MRIYKGKSVDKKSYVRIQDLRTKLDEVGFQKLVSK